MRVACSSESSIRIQNLDECLAGINIATDVSAIICKPHALYETDPVSRHAGCLVAMIDDVGLHITANK